VPRARRAREGRDEAGVRKKFGVPPAAIADFLALVGDAADGFPGLRGWGPASASAVLSRYGYLEQIPAAAAEWDVPVRGAARLAATLTAERERALLFRTLATLRADVPIGVEVDALRWTGPRPALADWSARLGAPSLHERAVVLSVARASS
jgi:5'-3' exonuclease